MPSRDAGDRPPPGRGWTEMALSEDWLRAYDSNFIMADEGPVRRCGTMSVNQAQMEAFPVFRTLQSSLEHMISERMSEPAAFAEPELVTIPVVVHVVARTDAQDVSDAQVATQIAVLNADYSGANADRASIPLVWSGLAGDSAIRFALATTDPDGRAHSGIVRVRTVVDGFGADDRVKAATTGGADAWPADRYCNLWVCDLRDVLGYAQFPGGPPATDGVVIAYTCFGTEGTAQAPFDLGRTATHEVGHWLNLRHIWGDTEDCSGPDFVADTPDQELPNYHVPSYPHVSCRNGPNGDMFMNYMDYVDDAAMCMFTAGQVARMRATLDIMRTGLASSGEAS